MPDHEILHDLTPANLGSAIERNQIEWVLEQGRLPDIDLYRDSEVIWIRSKRRGGPNHLCSIRFSATEATSRLETILEDYRRHRTPVSLWLGPGTTPVELPELLKKRGLRCVKHVPCMAVELQRVFSEVADPREQVPPELSVRCVKDLSLFEGLEHPFIGKITTGTRRRLIELFDGLAGLQPCRTWNFVAFEADVPVGVGTLFTAAGVAGIYDLGVLKSARRRRIGTAVTLAMLDHARSLGYRAAVLLASGMGEMLYRNLGFERRCTISHWYYSRSQQRREGY